MDFDAPTGFSKVSEEIFKGLEPFFTQHNIKVDILAYQKTKENRELYPGVKTYDAAEFTPDRIDTFSRDGFLKRITQKPYDLVWIMNDWPLIAPTMPVINMIKEKITENFGKSFKKSKEKDPVKAYTLNGKKPFKVMAYFPIDSPLMASLTRNMDVVDRAITYTNYGKKSITNSYNRFIPMLKEIGDNELADKMQKWIDTHEIGVIHHGIDTKTFYSDTEAGKKARAQYEIPENAFVFGSVNKNQPRKNVAQTIVAFAEMKKRLENHQDAAYNPETTPVVLYLHCHPYDPTGVNLISVCDTMGLVAGKDVFFPLMEKYEKAEYTQSDMKDVYNMFDCFVTTSMAEGWGLTLSEAVACDIPTIYGDHTSQSEIMRDINGRYVSIPVLAELIHFQPRDEGAKRYMLDPGLLIDNMVRAYYIIKSNIDSSEPKNKGYSLTEDYKQILERYTWEKATQMWEQELSQLLDL